MSSVNTTSVRDELERLRGEFDRVSNSGGVTPETKIIFQSLFMLVQLLVSVFMEKSLRKNSKNSHKPSSQTDKDESAKAAPSNQSRGKPEDLERSANSRTVVVHGEIAKVAACARCGSDLKNTPCIDHERRTKIDIVFEKVVTHVDAEIKNCPNCKAQTKGQFPADLHGPLQYGDGVKAYLINLVIAQMVALARAQKMMKSLIGVTIAESTILGFIMQLYKSLERWEVSAKEALLKSAAMHSDETSLRVAKKNHWEHVYSAGELTLKCLHAKRGKQAMDDIDILPRYSGVVVHDGWASFFKYTGCRHALCGSHLLRELTFVIESNGYPWAKNMKRLLQETCKKISLRESKKLTIPEYTRLQKRYRAILARGDAQLPEIPERSEATRGRIAKSDAHNLLERFKLHEDAILLFAKESVVPFTNNRAERDLRMDKVKQKVSGCFRSIEAANAYCRISSYLATMANRGVNPLIAIQMAINGLAPVEGGE